MRESKAIATWTAWTPKLLAALRIVASFMFVCVGTGNLLGFPKRPGSTGETVPLLSEIGIGGVIQIVGGLLALVGLCTRPVAFVMSGMMAVAYFQFHAPDGFFPTANGGMPAVLYCFVWLYISASGGGAWSLDGPRREYDAPTAVPIPGAGGHSEGL